MSKAKKELTERKKLPEEIKKLAFSQEEAKKALERIYAQAPDVQKPFGDTVDDIMRSLYTVPITVDTKDFRHPQ